MEPTLQQVITWAKAAGKSARDAFNEEHTIGLKGETDLVTEVDHACEKLILDSILTNFPDHSVITEETGKVKGSPDHCWYIDPLDGTVNYSHRVPIYAISIAYQHEGQLKLGVVYDPSHDECFSAERGRGAWLNDHAMRVSQADCLQRSLLVTGLPHNEADDKKMNHRMQIFGRLTNLSQGVRRLGSAAIDIAYVASGRLDGYWEEKINHWDIAAGALIALEAGATVTDLQGNPDFFKPPYSLVASAPGIHAEIVRILNNQE
jgi:myo-inositol-1(or 4)-monophosphatase